ncbi:hypothetical protein [Methylobacterium sp. J-076]|uniref:hypothetical protein n=1 Tax=Methylobacterium sp. J-076 TaxID=2836655 RepID=UPI001FBA65C8|nr:hypothetical protein [Methylobacterium sp. J-076]MCJ2014612.1 hypothetical protein [Methylobacterium sp. J-076]
MSAPASGSSPLGEAIARTLYEHDASGLGGAPPWDGDRLDAEHPGLRGRYRGRADALLDGPVADLLAGIALGAQHSGELEEELRVLRRQRIAAERERELLAANNRMLDRARTAEAARAEAETARATLERERDVAREAEAFWQQFAFDADDLATQRLVEAGEAQAAAEREAIRERAQRERIEGALRLFADRAEMMPKEGWVSDLAGLNRDLPLWWFHAAHAALQRAEPAAEYKPPQALGTAGEDGRDGSS